MSVEAGEWPPQNITDFELYGLIIITRSSVNTRASLYTQRICYDRVLQGESRRSTLAVVYHTLYMPQNRQKTDNTTRPASRRIRFRPSKRRRLMSTHALNDTHRPRNISVITNECNNTYVCPRSLKVIPTLKPLPWSRYSLLYVKCSKHRRYGRYQCYDNCDLTLYKVYFIPNYIFFLTRLKTIL